MKERALESKDDCSLWASTKCCKEFSKRKDSVKYSLKKCIISYPHVNRYLIENDNIKVKVRYGISGVENELRQKVLLQVSVL